MTRMKVVVTILLASVAIAGIGMALVHGDLRNHRLELKAYLRDAHGLRPGAPVRLAGVDVGRVKSVRARSDVQGGVAEVVMLLSTPYELKISSDSTVSLALTGVLGETFAEIDLGNATNKPVTSGSVLKAGPSSVQSFQELLEEMKKAVEPCQDAVRSGKDRAGQPNRDVR